MTSSILRTPDKFFQNLPGYSFLPNYIDNLEGYEGLRIHYLDEGDRNSKTTFLCLHGEPTWSYLYRKMIPDFVKLGGRVIAPDLIGFGKSDKPADDDIYTFSFHRNMLLNLITKLRLTNITLVCQDWGGLLGLTLPMEMPGIFKRLLVMNTTLSTGDKPLGEGFLSWRKYCNDNPNLDIASLMTRSTPHLTVAEAQAYAAPFPSIDYKAGVRRFPQLVSETPEVDISQISQRAKKWWKSEWNGESLMVIGMVDPILTPPIMYYLKKQINNCPEPLEIQSAGHFVQEWAEFFMPEILKKWKI